MYYKQLFTQMDNGLNPASRRNALLGYFSRYLPSLMSRVGGYCEAFIDGYISYEKMLFIINACQIAEDTNQKISHHIDIKACISLKNSLDSINREKRLFIDAFGPDRPTTHAYVRGTVVYTQNRIHKIGAW